MANIMRRRPMFDLLSARNDIDSFFNDAFRIWEEGASERLGWKPAVDMVEGEKEFVITAELPGVKKEDVKISLQDNKLVISGEMKEDKDVQEKNYYLMERARGKFSRSFTLPSNVDSSKTDAKYENGVLKLTLPKSQAALPREIEIK